MFYLLDGTFPQIQFHTRSLASIRALDFWLPQLALLYVNPIDGFYFYSPFLRVHDVSTWQRCCAVPVRRAGSRKLDVATRPVANMLSILFLFIQNLLS